MSNGSILLGRLRTIVVAYLASTVAVGLTFILAWGAYEKSLGLADAPSVFFIATLISSIVTIPSILLLMLGRLLLLRFFPLARTMPLATTLLFAVLGVLMMIAGAYIVTVATRGAHASVPAFFLLCGAIGGIVAGAIIGRIDPPKENRA